MGCFALLLVYEYWTSCVDVCFSVVSVFWMALSLFVCLGWEFLFVVSLWCGLLCGLGIAIAQGFMFLVWLRYNFVFWLWSFSFLVM